MPIPSGFKLELLKQSPAIFTEQNKKLIGIIKKVEADIKKLEDGVKSNQAEGEKRPTEKWKYDHQVDVINQEISQHQKQLGELKNIQTVLEKISNGQYSSAELKDAVELAIAKEKNGGPMSQWLKLEIPPFNICLLLKELCIERIYQNCPESKDQALDANEKNQILRALLSGSLLKFINDRGNSDAAFLSQNEMSLLYQRERELYRVMHTVQATTDAKSASTTPKPATAAAPATAATGVSGKDVKSQVASTPQVKDDSSTQCIEELMAIISELENNKIPKIPRPYQSSMERMFFRSQTKQEAPEATYLKSNYKNLKMLKQC